MSKIRKPSTTPKRTKISSPTLPSNTNLCFNFADYKKQSININKFNNCFQNEHECFSVINKSFEKIKHISNCPNFYALQSDTNMHCHIIENDFKELVRSILVQYGFPSKKIEELFEGEIYQVKIADGSPEARLVFYLVGGNILTPLFLDTNHQLYKSKNRGFDINLKTKNYTL